MTPQWTDGFIGGRGWNAWVRPPRTDGEPWRWEATCLGSPAVWQQAATEAEAQAAALLAEQRRVPWERRP